MADISLLRQINMTAIDIINMTAIDIMKKLRMHSVHPGLLVNCNYCVFLCIS